MLTFGLQVEVMVWARLRTVDEFSHDDGEAEDVALGRSVKWDTHLSQVLWSCPVHLWDTVIENTDTETSPLLTELQRNYCIGVIQLVHARLI